jgi:hypothetical protein
MGGCLIAYVQDTSCPNRARRTSPIVLLDTSQDLTECAAELGCDVGQLLTPLTRYRLRDSLPWAIDNGAFSMFEEKSFLSLLQREEHNKASCLFVTAPDIVGSARRTLEVFERWKSRLSSWPVALACQDGQEDLPIPWDEISAVFIGGSTNWKLSDCAAQCIKAAKALGKWTHVGRVNDPARFDYFEKLGADSIDGTGISRFSHMREAISKRDNQGKLLEPDPA